MTTCLTELPHIYTGARLGLSESCDVDAERCHKKLDMMRQVHPKTRKPHEIFKMRFADSHIKTTILHFRYSGRDDADKGQEFCSIIPELMFFTVRNMNHGFRGKGHPIALAQNRPLT